MSAQGSVSMQLTTFECPEQHVIWESHIALYGQRRLVGSGKSLFQITTRQPHAVFVLDERHIVSWDVDEENALVFQGLAMKDDTWCVLYTDGGCLKDQDDTVYHEIESIEVLDCRGCHRTFDGHLDAQRFLRRQVTTVRKLASDHNLDISSIVFWEESESDDDSSIGPVDDKVLNETTQEEETPHEMTDEEIAIMMQQELQEQVQWFVVSSDVDQHMTLLSEHVENKEFEKALEIAATIRNLFHACEYRPNAEHELCSLSREILGDDLSHVESFAEMESLKRTHNYVKVQIVPKELLGDNEALANSNHNIVYVTKVVAERIAHVHSMLEVVVNQGANLPKGKQIQLQMQMKKISKLSYIPNALVYQVRGFKNFDMKVNLW